MKNLLLKEEIIHHIDRLPSEQQRQVLNFARVLEMARPRGRKGKSLLMFSGAIPAVDLQAMADNIEAGCEKVDANEW
jgi:hypothetical protein